jgi:undecaprenyl-diphosphatase
VASIGGLLVFKMRSSALGLGASIAGALVLNWALKHAFHRARPVPFFVVDPESFSFPSGHVFFALCFYLAFLLIFRGHRWAAAPIALLATFLVIGIGWSRIYLGVHYPTDVIGGCLAGIFWLGTLRGCGFFT